MRIVSPPQNSQRIAPLAVLPVFFTLTERRALIVGGGAPAAWKAELLAAAGAEVEVFAEEAGEEMRGLSGVTLWDRRWRLILAVGDFDPKEREDMVEPDGKIRVTCEYCATVHELEPDDVVTAQI